MSYSREFRLLLAELGVTNERLPVEGLPPRDVFGVTFWITPLPARPAGVRGRPYFRLRVMCECPTCGTAMSASRLQQHAGSTKCAIAAHVRSVKCVDCGKAGEFTGHQDCQFPKDHA